MTHVLKPYPAYRDSGSPWLGEVPEHWEVRRLKQICRIEYGDSLASEARQEGIVPVFGSNGRVGFHNVANTKAPCIIVGRKGSFGKINYSDVSVFAIDTTFFIDSRFSFSDIRWLYFILEWLQLDDVTKDSAIPGLDRRDAYQRLAPVPPIPEQAAIARYLDHVCERIGRYIGTRERLIALLKERKQAIIDRAVTRGLDPNAPMKPTGITWMPEVPAHWEVRRLKRICRIEYGDSLASEARQEGIVPVFGSNGRVGFHNVANTKAPCIIVGRKGSFGKINYSDVSVFAIDTTFFIDSLFSFSDIRWLYFLLKYLHLDDVTKDSAIPGLDREDAYQRLAPVPPLSEQATIVERLERSTAAIDAAIDRARRQIDLLREYRERLINDVVTGKLDVREARVAASPDADAPQEWGQAPSHRAEAGAPAIP